MGHLQQRHPNNKLPTKASTYHYHREHPHIYRYPRGRQRIVTKDGNNVLLTSRISTYHHPRGFQSIITKDGGNVLFTSRTST